LSIYRNVSNELKRYGESITVNALKGRFFVKGIIEPLLYKNKLYLGGKQLPDGFFDGGHYLLICPPEINLPVLGDAFIEGGGKRYILKRSETVSIKSKALYTWAVLTPYNEPSEEDFYEA